VETYREHKQDVYREYARSYDDSGLMLDDHALTAHIAFVADGLGGLSPMLDLGCGTGGSLTRTRNVAR
jgi:ubiquinone/menaquinone biosynthesis C-methylase UbiE